MARNTPTLAQRIQTLRAARFPSVRQAVASSAKSRNPVPLATWTEIENGTNTNPKLASLIGIAQALGCRASDLLEAQEAHGVREVPLVAVFANPLNPRREFDPDDLAELAKSIKQHGLLQPITVRPFTHENVKGEAFEIVLGERRWRASNIAFGASGTIKVIVRDISDAELALLMLTENLQRVDMAPLDTADALARAAKSHSTDELANASGRSRRWVQEMVQVGNNLCDDARTYLQQGHLKISHAVILAGIQDKGEQAALAVYATTLTEDGLRKLVAETKAKKAAPSLPIVLADSPPPAPPHKNTQLPGSGSVPPEPPPPAPPAPPKPAAAPSIPTNGPAQVVSPDATKHLPPATLNRVAPSLAWDKTNALELASNFIGVVFEPNGGPVKETLHARSWPALCALVEQHFPDSNFIHAESAWQADIDGEPTFASFGQLTLVRMGL